jgi:hypothetical protein
VQAVITMLICGTLRRHRFVAVVCRLTCGTEHCILVTPQLDLCEASPRAVWQGMCLTCHIDCGSGQSWQQLCYSTQQPAGCVCHLICAMTSTTLSCPSCHSLPLPTASSPPCFPHLTLCKAGGAGCRLLPPPALTTFLVEAGPAGIAADLGPIPPTSASPPGPASTSAQVAPRSTAAATQYPGVLTPPQPGRHRRCEEVRGPERWAGVAAGWFACTGGCVPACVWVTACGCRCGAREQAVPVFTVSRGRGQAAG